uniref:Granulins domain-containing protein n=2 Tax=Monopterus albus TaxID=43700 RepID=A0A3Q3K3V4_MONAL
MTALSEASGGAHKVGVIRCDSRFYCPQGKSCCKGPKGQWTCCPYPLGQCCADGRHCCMYGYKCDPSSLSCTK